MAHEGDRQRMTIESLMNLTLVALIALAVFALTVAVLTFGGPGIAIFSAGVAVGWLLPRPRSE